MGMFETSTSSIARSSAAPGPFECASAGSGDPTRGNRGFFLVRRALRNHNVWLVLTYFGLIFLMARAYA